MIAFTASIIFSVPVSESLLIHLPSHLNSISPDFFQRSWRIFCFFSPVVRVLTVEVKSTETESQITEQNDFIEAIYEESEDEDEEEVWADVIEDR